MLSDIEISKNAKLLHIKEVAKKIGIEEDDLEAIRYIGGITGYAYNSRNDTGYVVIEECNSSPVYDKEYLTDMMESLSSKEDSLKGVYVGGIVGYNYNGQINSCSTKAKNRDEEGYVVGCKFRKKKRNSGIIF